MLGLDREGEEGDVVVVDVVVDSFSSFSVSKEEEELVGEEEVVGEQESPLSSFLANSFRLILCRMTNTMSMTTAYEESPPENGSCKFHLSKRALNTRDKGTMAGIKVVIWMTKLVVVMPVWLGPSMVMSILVFSISILSKGTFE